MSSEQSSEKSSAEDNLVTVQAEEDNGKSLHIKGEEDQSETSLESSAKEKSEKICETPIPAEVTNQVWYEFIDPSSSKPYYHNYITKETTWTAPTVFIPHNVVMPKVNTQQTPNYIDPRVSLQNFNHTGTGNIADELKAIAYFNSKDGRYTGSSSHWDALGIPQDRSARQLARYMDLKDLEKNREEAKIIRQQVAKSKSKEEWAEYNKQKKDAKRRRQLEWLVKDD